MVSGYLIKLHTPHMGIDFKSDFVGLARLPCFRPSVFKCGNFIKLSLFPISAAATDGGDNNGEERKWRFGD